MSQSIWADEDCSDILIREKLFYQVATAPALIITLLFCFTKTRRHLFPDVLQGRPGLVYPMDLTTKSKRLAYACAFGSTTFLILKILLNDYGKIFQSGNSFLNGMMTILTAVAYGTVYLPVFACLTMDNAVGYGVGALYSCMLTIVSFVALWNCQPDVSTWFIKFLFLLPYLICSIYLSCNNTIRFYITFKRGEYFDDKPESKWEDRSLETMKLSVPWKHVQSLLAKPTNIESRTSLSRTVFKFILDHTYCPDPKFQYSARFLATMLTGSIILYQSVFYMLTLASDYDRNEFPIGIFITGVFISTLLGVYNIMRHVSCYRRDTYRMYGGQLKDKMENMPNVSLLVGAMQYSGYEIIHIFLSFWINVVFIVLTLWVVYMVINHELGLIKSLFIYISPLIFWKAVSFISQRLTARYVVLQSPTESLALTNRRVFFIFAHIIFFFNIALGSIVFVFRTLLNLAIVLFLQNRLDQSSFPPEYLHFDSAYRAYLGSLKLECSQSHPVMLVFIGLLTLSARNRRGQYSDANRTTEMANRRLSRRREAAVFHWHLLYTLINNPSIRIERRGYLQKLARARDLGISIPKSDVIMDQYAICNLLAELEKDGTLSRSDLSTTKEDRKNTDLFRRLLVRIQNRLRGGPSRLEEEIVGPDLHHEPRFGEIAQGGETMGTLSLQLQIDGMNQNDHASYVI